MRTPLVIQGQALHLSSNKSRQKPVRTKRSRALLLPALSTVTTLAFVVMLALIVLTITANRNAIHGRAGVISRMADVHATMACQNGTRTPYRADDVTLVTHLFTCGTSVLVTNPANGRKVIATVVSDRPVYDSANGFVAHLSEATADAIGYTGPTGAPVVLKLFNQSHVLSNLLPMVKELLPSLPALPVQDPAVLKAVAMNMAGECLGSCDVYGRQAVVESLYTRLHSNFNGRRWKNLKELVFARIPGTQTPEYSWAVSEAEIDKVRRRVTPALLQEAANRLTDHIDTFGIGLAYNLHCADFYHAPEVVKTPGDRKKMKRHVTPMSTVLAKHLKHEFYQACAYLPEQNVILLAKARQQAQMQAPAVNVPLPTPRPQPDDITSIILAAR